MSDDAIPVTVRILDKEYRVACQPQEREELIESARMLDQRMRDVRQTGRVIGSDRIAVMAALNIAHELIQLRLAHEKMNADLGRRMSALQVRVADALSSNQQLDAHRESV